MTGFVRAAGTEFVAGDGRPVRLRGIGIGGWLTMENFVTGHAATESLTREALTAVLGPRRAALFFDRLLSVFFAEADAALLAGCGLNSVRVPVSYRHWEDDARPFELREHGFEQLDRVLRICGDRGIRVVIDLHALPGYQNQRWHSDNPTHVALFWDHPHFQDRVVNLWSAIAERYRDDPRVLGYNLVNEPADPGRQVVGAFYRRLVEAVREVDGRHILFLDGNTYATEFDVFTERWDNVVYTCHDYARAGLGYGGPYPGRTRGQWVDRKALERTFLARTRFPRETGTPVWIGEFGPIYRPGTADSDRTDRLQILRDQLAIFEEHGASWSLWTYKDIGLQGLAVVSGDSPYLRRFASFLAKKQRLGADNWGTDGTGLAEVTQPVFAALEREFPHFDPYPWGLWEWARTILLNILFAQPLVEEYAALFAGLDDDALLALADSFSLEQCVVRDPVVAALRKATGSPA
jgi:endoglucanase